MPRNRVSTARVVELRQNGLTNKEISKILGVSDKLLVSDITNICGGKRTIWELKI